MFTQKPMGILPGANAAGPPEKKRILQTVSNVVKRNGMPLHDASKKKENEKPKRTNTKRHQTSDVVAVNPVNVNNLFVESLPVEMMDFTPKLHTIYEQELRLRKMLIPAVEMIDIFVAPQFDQKTRRIVDSKYVILRCEEFEVKETVCVVLTCSCNPRQQERLKSMSRILSEYPSSTPCIHIDGSASIVMSMYFAYDRSVCHDLRDLTEESEEETKQGEIIICEYDTNKLFVAQDNSYGIVGHHHRKTTCYICPPYSTCAHVSFVKDNRGNSSYPAIDVFFDRIEDPYVKRQRQCISTDMVPFRVPREGNYSEILTARPEEVFRSENNRYVAEESEVRQILQELLHAVSDDCPSQGVVRTSKIVPAFFKDKTCKCEVVDWKCKSCCKSFKYDGGKDGLLRMEGFLLSHRVLRDYMNYFLFGNSMTFHHFYTVYANSMINEYFLTNFRKEFSYPKFLEAWYAYQKLLDIDLTEGFCCDVCGTSPDLIVCDGTSLGFRRELLMSVLENSPELSKVAIERKSFRNQRIAVTDLKARENIASFFKKDGMTTVSERKALCSIPGDINMSRLFSWLCSHFHLQYQPVSSLPIGVKNFFSCLGTPSPVCSYLFPTEDNIKLIKELAVEDIKSNYEKYERLEQQLPVFYGLLRDLKGLDRLPKEFEPVLSYLVNQAESPFNPGNTIPVLKSTTDPKLECFPSQPILRGRGFYTQDQPNAKKKENRCHKIFNKHKKLLPGIFTVYCQHGVCYGYSVMQSKESPDIPFTILKTRWEKAPSTVVYDFACSLQDYCLNRDPIFFKNTRFVVDKFHWKNHTACSQGYNMTNYCIYDEVNTQINEQQNSSTKNLDKQLSYMTENNFLTHCTFFMWWKNQEKKEKIRFH